MLYLMHAYARYLFFFLFFKEKTLTSFSGWEEGKGKVRKLERETPDVHLDRKAHRWCAGNSERPQLVGEGG